MLSKAQEEKKRKKSHQGWGWISKCGPGFSNFFIETKKIFPLGIQLQVWDPTFS